VNKTCLYLRRVKCIGWLSRVWNGPCQLWKHGHVQKDGILTEVCRPICLSALKGPWEPLQVIVGWGNQFRLGSNGGFLGNRLVENRTRIKKEVQNVQQF
jgi:hypothetical protein